MAMHICETCGSPLQQESTACEDCGEPVSPRSDIRRLPHEVVLSFLEHAEQLLASSPLRQAVPGKPNCLHSSGQSHREDSAEGMFPIVAFVAIGLRHSPANMGYFSVGLINGGSGISWGEALYWNILPASLGNIIGGAGLVALLFWYTYGRRPHRRQGLKQVQ